MKRWRIEGLDGNILGEFNSKEDAIGEFLTWWPNFDKDSLDPYIYEETIYFNICNGDPKTILLNDNHINTSIQVKKVLSFTLDYYKHKYGQFAPGTDAIATRELSTRILELWKINFKEIDFKNIPRSRRPH